MFGLNSTLENGTIGPHLTFVDRPVANSNGTVNFFIQQIAGGVTHIFNQNSILDVRLP